jgi:hypothetical protein
VSHKTRVGIAAAGASVAVLALIGLAAVLLVRPGSEQAAEAAAVAKRDEARIVPLSATPDEIAAETRRHESIGTAPLPPSDRAPPDR